MENISTRKLKFFLFTFSSSRMRKTHRGDLFRQWLELIFFLFWTGTIQKSKNRHSCPEIDFYIRLQSMREREKKKEEEVIYVSLTMCIDRLVAFKYHLEWINFYFIKFNLWWSENGKSFFYLIKALRTKFFTLGFRLALSL